MIYQLDVFITVGHHDDIIYISSTMFDSLWWLLVLPLGLILYVIYHFFVKIYLVARQFKKMDPDLPILVTPIVGLLGFQQENFRKYGDSLRYVKDMVREKPDTKAYFTNIGHRPMLILCEAQLVKEYLLGSKKFRKFNLYKHNDITYKQGLFLADEEMWTRQKAIVKHSFNHENMKKMIPSMEKSIKRYTKDLITKIQSSDAKAVDFKVLHDTETLIGEILVSIIFTEEAIDKQVNGTPLSIALAVATVNMFDRSRSAPNLFWSLFFGEGVATINLSKKDKDLYNLYMEIRKIINEILDARLAIGENPDKDFIQVYIDQMRENDRLIAEANAKGEAHNIIPIGREEILQQLISFYFAGIDTTGHLVAFSIYCLAEYPEYRNKIIAEIKSIFGDNIQDASYENLGKMQFTGYFIDEVLRMWPPATGNLARVAKEDVKIGPFSIPKGMLMGSNILGLMQNPKYYDKPQIFNPYRWADPTTISKQPYSFIPFSAGPRSCIGKYVSLMETKLILIHFLNHFDFARTAVPLRETVKFLYEPYDEDLVRLSVGGMKLN